MTWGVSLLAECSFVYIAAAFSPVVLFLGRRFPTEGKHLWRNVGLHAIAMLIYGVIVRISWELFMDALGMQVGPWELSRVIRAVCWSLSDAAPTYWLIILFQNAGHYYQRYQAGLVDAANLNAQLARAQLMSLRMQLNPHFLFNTLHAISELVHEDPNAAERMIISLSQLLRMSLDTSTLAEVPLREELRFTDLYLSIEKVRFEGRLEIHADIDPELRNALVPNLILQPLIENAIRHGISKRPGKGRIELSAKQGENVLIITIRDNGVGAEMDNVPLREGIGLSSTRSRLDKLYGPHQSFQFVRRAGQGAEAVIRLPLRFENAVGAVEYAESANR